jgi:histidyl-tRNA synthetase
MFKRVPGTKDILPEEVLSWQTIETIARRIFSVYNYQEIRTPIIEDAALFNRTLGEATEIVQKQMFIIRNQDDNYALRPEGTASIVRCYLENSLDKAAGFVKLYYIGPMFRLERPQKGRLRQFHHIGCEAIGSGEPSVDVEIISLAGQLLKNLGITGYKIKLNSLGCLKDKQELGSTLKEKLQKKSNQLCPDCRDRMKNNVLRVLDCKNEACREIVKELSPAGGHLCPECLQHFDKVKEGLSNLNIEFEVSCQLVRGLDYYNRTVFEITHPDLGSQDAIGAGGRYSNLVKELGGPQLEGIGFAFGIERLLLAKTNLTEKPDKKLIYLVTLGDAAKIAGVKILNRLREAKIPADMDYLNKSLKGAMRAANDAGASKVLILGDDELKKNIISIKDMSDSSQKEISLENLTGELKC